MKHFAYIVCCSDGTYYTGYTNDLDKRMVMHNQGKGAKYTNGRTPVTLVYCEEFLTKSDAMRREYMIKQLNRSQKEYLIRQNGANAQAE